MARVGARMSGVKVDQEVKKRSRRISSSEVLKSETFGEKVEMD